MRFKRTVATGRWTSSLATLALSGTLGACIAYWALQLFAPTIAIAPPGSLVDQSGAPDLSASVRLFGEPGGQHLASAPALANIQLLGVAVASLRASAVIAVDGKSARAYMVGDTIAPQLRLIEVRPDFAVVEQRGARLELAAPKRPTTDVLWSGPARSGSAGDARPPVATAAPAGAPAPLTTAGPQGAAAPIEDGRPRTPPAEPAQALPEGSGTAAGGGS